MGLEGILGSFDEIGTPESKPLAETLLDIVPENIFQALTLNEAMLSVIFFALLAGIFITKLNDNHRAQLTGFFNAFFELMMKITLFVVKLAPLGIFGLVAVVAAEQSANTALIAGLGKYMLTVVAGLLFHNLITLPLILVLVAKVNPLKHYRAMATPIITAFSTASSNATLPVTIETVE